MNTKASKEDIERLRKLRPASLPRYDGAEAIAKHALISKTQSGKSSYATAMMMGILFGNGIRTLQALKVANYDGGPCMGCDETIYKGEYYVEFDNGTYVHMECFL